MLSAVLSSNEIVSTHFVKWSIPMKIYRPFYGISDAIGPIRSTSQSSFGYDFLIGLFFVLIFNDPERKHT